MIFIDFLFAFFIALALAGILAAFTGDRRTRRTGAWPLFLFLFFLLLMTTWAGGVWLTPFGPILWGACWPPFLAVAVTGIPRSGSPGRLMNAFGISTRRIREAVEAITSHSPKTDHD